MTGPEHYREAEQLLAAAEELRGKDQDPFTWYSVTRAQVHATLALAAATVFNRPQGGFPDTEWAAWWKVAAEKVTP